MPTPVGPQTPRPRSNEWVARAACVGLPEVWFFPDERGRETKARRVCGQCPVQRECLAYALFHNIEHGVWGNTTPRQRHRMSRGKTFTG